MENVRKSQRDEVILCRLHIGHPKFHHLCYDWRHQRVFIKTPPVIRSYVESRILLVCGNISTLSKNFKTGHDNKRNPCRIKRYKSTNYLSLIQLKIKYIIFLEINIFLEDKVIQTFHPFSSLKTFSLFTVVNIYYEIWTH